MSFWKKLLGIKGSAENKRRFEQSKTVVDSKVKSGSEAIQLPSDNMSKDILNQRARSLQEVSDDWEKSIDLSSKLSNEVLREKVIEPNTTVIMRSVAACELATRGCVEMLREIAAMDRISAVAAIDGLTSNACDGDYNAIEALSESLRHSDTIVRLRVVRMAEIVADGTPGVHGVSTKAIRERARSILQNAMSDIDERVRRTAVQCFTRTANISDLRRGADVLTYRGRRMAESSLDLLKANADIYFTKAEDYFSRGEYGKAIAEYDKALDAYPGYTDVYLARGAAHALNGDAYDLAIQDYSKAIEIEPNNAEAYYYRGVSHYYKKDYIPAISDLTHAIELDSEYANAYYQRGVVYCYTGHGDKAVMDFGKAIKLDPDNPKYYIDRGLLYSYRSNFEDSINDFSWAIKLDPKNTEAYSSRALSYFKLKQYDKAWQDVKRLQDMGSEVDRTFLSQLRAATGYMDDS